MTLHLLGIAAEESDEPQTECDANPIDQFWMAAGDLLIEIVKRQPDIQPIIDAVIDAALAEPSGLRHVLLAEALRVAPAPRPPPCSALRHHRVAGSQSA